MSEGSEENCPAPKVSDIVIITDAQEREMHLCDSEAGISQCLFSQVFLRDCHQQKGHLETEEFLKSQSHIFPSI